MTSDISVDTTIHDDAMEMAIEAMFKIYSYPHSALIREYVANAVDEHITRGVAVPVEVNWDYLGVRDGRATYQIAITDHGGGMTPEVLSEVYTQIRLSGKREDENTTGGFGIGAKVGLAVSDEGFDVITSTGEQAAILRCRHVSQGRIRNDIDVIDPDGIPRGTTVKVTFAANQNQLADMAMMLMAMALASDVKIRMSGDLPPSFLYAPYVIETDSESPYACTVYPHGVLSGAHAPLSSGHLVTIATVRAYRARRLLPLSPEPIDRSYFSGDQFSNANVVYLNNTPYPLNYDNGNDNRLRFGLLDIPLEGVSIPRHREAINGVDLASVTSRSMNAHQAVVADLADEFSDEFTFGYADFQEATGGSPSSFIAYLMARSVNPSLAVHDFVSGDRGYHLDRVVSEKVAQKVLDDRSLSPDTTCDGLVIYTSPKEHKEAEKFLNRLPITRVSDISYRIVGQSSTDYSGPAPAAIIQVPDLPRDAFLTNTEVSRIRHNLKKMFPTTFLEARPAFIVRSVPDELVNLATVRRFLHSTRRCAPVEKDENDIRTTPHPYSGTASWGELTAKISRNGTASARRYIEITVDPVDLSLSTAEAMLSLDEVRGQLTAGDVLFLANSRKLSKRDPSAAVGIISSLQNFNTRWFDPAKAARFLAWSGIERVYLYADESSSSTARKAITDELMVRLDEMDQAHGEFENYLDDLAAEEVMSFKNCYTLAHIASAMGIAAPPTIASLVARSYESIGIKSAYPVTETLNVHGGYGELIYSKVRSLKKRRGPLFDVSERSGEKLVADVLKSDEAYRMLTVLCISERDYKVRPPELMDEITKSGGISELSAKLDGLTFSGRRAVVSSSDINTESEMFGEIRARIDDELSAARSQIAAMVSLLTAGEVTLQQIESAAEDEHAAYMATLEADESM